MSNEALAVVEQEQGLVTTQRGILTRDALVAAAEQRKLLGEYVAKQMVEGTDYGVIPGTKDKSLLKPGAEKLVDIFRCTPKFAIVSKVEDFERGLFAYTFRVRLFQRDAEAVLAEGYGSANSYEGRYRWRNAAKKCPRCGQEAIIRGKEEYGGGWICFAKKGGCGSKWKDGDERIEKQETGKVVNDDVATLANTILKMAKKRALVDGAIALARVSDMFKQDMEDLAAAAEEEPQKPAPKKAAPSKPAPAPAKSDADAMVAECERGFTDWEKKRAWADANKERKAALSEADRERVGAAFRAAHPKNKPPEPPPVQDAEFADDAKEPA